MLQAFLSSEATIPLLAVVPFILTLLAIAVLPLAFGHWWEHNRNKAIVSAVLALPVLIWGMKALPHELGHSAHEYLSFIILLGSLFVVSGGLLIAGDLQGLPRTNVTFMAFGAVIASLVGTTGAAMVLIRPLLRANKERKRVVHTVVFFIFIVCNCGGLLTPLGDPPLFLGYLKGVPFTWTFRLWPEWLGVNLVLLTVYLIWDSIAVRKEGVRAIKGATRASGIRLHGVHNILLLLAVVGLVAFAPANWREGGMVAVAILSLAMTKKEVHEKNGFSWGPIIEVAILFAGIFATMVPALQYLQQHAKEFGISTPIQFFWLTGILSSFLDNAPTYLTFVNVAAGLGLTDPHSISLQNIGTLPEVHLEAISLGAVFMGANTYIGNGPNFMVKAIADSSGVKMPSFFGYMLYALGVLIPTFIVVGYLVFMR